MIRGILCNRGYTFKLSLGVYFAIGGIVCDKGYTYQCWMKASIGCAVTLNEQVAGEHEIT